MAKISRRFLSDELQLSLTGMQRDIGGLTGAVQGLELNVAGLTGRTAALETGMRSLEMGLTGANKNIAGLTGAVYGLELYVAGLTGRTASLELGMTGANSNIAALGTAVGDLQTYVAGLTGGISSLSTRMTGAERDIAGLTGSVYSLQQYVSGLTGLDASLTLRMTGAESDIAGLTGAVLSLEQYVAGLTGRTSVLESGMTGVLRDISGLTGRTATLEAGMTGANKNIAGLTGAMYSLEQYVAGLTGRTAALETGMTGAQVSIAGLTGALSDLRTYVGASIVGFSPIIGIGDTNVQGAIQTLKTYIDSGITGVGLITGAQGVTGASGVGATGAQGYTGIAGVGYTGLRGVTGLSIVMDSMLVEETKGITGTSFTGPQATPYSAITGLQNSILIPATGKILSLSNLKYKHTTAGSVTVGFMLQRDGVTGISFSDYLTDNRERVKTLYEVSPTVGAGTHTYQMYWNLDATNKVVVLEDSAITSILLEGALGETGIKGVTGVIGVQGPTGAFGGPAGVTGFQGATGLWGAVGATGPGVASFSQFAKIIPMEEWKTTNLAQDIHGEVPVLEFSSDDPIERMDLTIPVPMEWDGSSNMTLRMGTIIDLPASTGDQAVFKLSYRGFLKTDNVASLAPLYTDTQTVTLSSPAQYDAHEFVFTVTGSNVASKDYILLRIDKVTGSPNLQKIGVYSTQLEYGVSVGMGPTGYQGVTGMYGFTGLVGVTGLIGVTGLSSDTGVQGITGVQGLTGVQGITGLIGVTGLSSETGVQGLTGTQGITGIPAGDTGVYCVNFYSDSYLTPTVSQSIALEKSVQINKWRMFSFETGSAQVRLDVGQYPPSFRMDAGSTGPNLELEGVKISTDFSNWAGTTGAYDELLKVSFVGVTGIKSLGLNLYYSKV